MTKTKSFHRVPSGTPKLIRSASRRDIRAARQGTGRTVDTLATPNSGAKHGMRAMFMTLSDAEIRGILVAMGDRESAIHLKSQNQLVDAIFNCNPSQAEIEEYLAQVSLARAESGGKDGRKASTSASRR